MKNLIKNKKIFSNEHIEHLKVSHKGQHSSQKTEFKPRYYQPTNEELYQLYIIQKLTITQISLKINTPRPTIYKKLKKLNYNKTISESKLGKTFEMIYGFDIANIMKENIRKRGIKHLLTDKAIGKRSGKNHPNWLGGTKSWRGSDWKIQRKKALIRDNYQCVFCSESNDKLDIHHIISYRKTKNNSLDNLLTLCCKCHRIFETGGFRIRIYGDTNEEIETKLKEAITKIQTIEKSIVR